jgi:surface protein
MLAMFRNLYDFNGNLSNWDVSNVTNMSQMLRGTRSFNSNISNWNVSNVTSMNRMFDSALTFNQDLSGWCVSQISSEPSGFATNTPNWVLAKPNWGAAC